MEAVDLNKGRIERRRGRASRAEKERPEKDRRGLLRRQLQGWGTVTRGHLPLQCDGSNRHSTHIGLLCSVHKGPQ